MKKLLLLFFLSICSAALFAQGMLVNRYFNSAAADGLGDVVELVVVTDHLDIRKWFIKDYGNGTAVGAARLDEGGGKIRFNDIPFWGDLRSGTVIVLRKRTATPAALATFTPAYVPDVDASDFIIDIDLNDTNYMTDIYPDKAFNVTPHEMVLIRADKGDVPAKATPDTERLAFLNGANKAVHALAYGDFNFVNTFNGVKSPKAIYNNGPFNATSYVGNGSIGMVTLTNPNVATYTTPLSKSNALITLPSYWNKETTLTSTMPYGIEVYRSTTDYALNGGNARKMNAYCVVLDPKYVELKPAFSATSQLPTDFITAENAAGTGTVLACMNAGFFGANVGYSMLKWDGTTYVNNPNILNRTYQGNSTPYYTTRAAFGLSPSKVPDVTWTYKIGNDVYSYDTPNPNDVNQTPQPEPTAAGGIIWDNVTAVGGAPMLVKNRAVIVSDTEELIEVDNTSLRARTGIGYTYDGKVILLAVEGNNPGVADGLTLVEMANYMKDMGCEGAINLDGGGSTFLRVGNQTTVKPSPAGVERAMPYVILVKSKN